GAAAFPGRPASVGVGRGALSAVRPLVRRDGMLGLVGARDLYEPADFAYVDGEALAELLGELKALRLPVFLSRVPATSPTVKAMRRAFRASGFTRGAGG